MTSLPMADREFALFQGLMRELTGVCLGPAKKAMVVSRLTRRVRDLGLPSFDSYFRRIAGGGDPQELQQALDLLTTHETYFFREPRHFQCLADRVLAEARPGQPFRVWSAASSSGEEAYSLAMVLMDRLGPSSPWEVVGSDIGLEVLERARTGIYGTERISGLPPAYLKRFCLRGIGRQEGTLRIAAELRRRVRFQQANLLDNLASLGEFNVAFLRNVLIYFDRPTKAQVVRQVAARLKPGGWLFVGHSESLNGIEAPLRPAEPTVYRRI